MTLPMSLHHRYFHTFAVLTLLLVSAFTQTAFAEKETTSVTFSALCFTTGNAENPVFYIADGTKREKLSIPFTMLGGPFKAQCREGGLLDFYTAETDEAPAITVKIPATATNNLLVIFYPSDGQQPSYKAQVVQLPANGFHGGSWLAFNLTKSDIAFRLNKKPNSQIKPGTHKLITPPKNLKDPMLPVEIYKRSKDKQWQIEQSVLWPVDPRFKNYLFLFQTSTSGRLQLRSVPQRIE